MDQTMKHTLQSLLALAATDEGKEKINVIVAELCNAGEPIKGYVVSLDAMAEAKRRLSDEEDSKFRDWLYCVIPQPAKVRRFHNPEPVEEAMAFILTVQEELT